jgi:exosortase/archaeosortase family protein
MKKSSTEIIDISVRYFILLIIGVNFYLFYLIFTPLTIYPVLFLLNLFFQTSLINNIILINQEIPIEIISACIAGSAYYLLLILNLSTQGIKLKKRILMLSLAFVSLLILNILRIFILSFIFITFEGSFFDIVHKFFWYFASIIFVAFIWFFEVHKFKIKQVPFYSDIKYIFKLKKNKNQQ